MLIEIAKKRPEKDVDLAGIGLSPKQIKMWGEDVLSAMKRGMHAPIVKREQPKRPDESVLKRLEKIKSWRKKVAQDIKVESDIILPKMYLNVFAENPPKTMSDLESAMADSPWRFKTYGTQILDLFGG